MGKKSKLAFYEKPKEKPKKQSYLTNYPNSKKLGNFKTKK